MILSKTLSQYPQLFNKRCNIYKLTRNFFISQMEYGFCNTIGYIEVKWDRDTAFDKLLTNICETFIIMYRMNFLLWKEEVKLNQK